MNRLYGKDRYTGGRHSSSFVSGARSLGQSQLVELRLVRKYVELAEVSFRWEVDTLGEVRRALQQENSFFGRISHE
jgi:hypothetical protein